MPGLVIEGDYQSRYRCKGEFLFGAHIEIIREPCGRGEYKHALFDFDGTLSLIRQGWMEVMVPMMVEILLETPNHESVEELGGIVREYVYRLTGKQTIYQMIQLVDEIKKRGGTPLAPLEYKNEYNRRLMKVIHERREALRTGQAKPKDMLVPNSLELLDALRERGVQVYLASGTDEPYVKEEADLLQLTQYFGEHIYGAQADYKTFSKAMVIERILSIHKIEGRYLLGFGDAYVEIENVKSVGGAAVGVASDEAERSGKPDLWKRERLVGVGADVIIPDYRECNALVDYLFPA